MTMEVVAELPKLTGLKHRSTAVTDSGMEHLSRSKTLESLLMQDFVITDLSGQHLAKLEHVDAAGDLPLPGIRLRRACWLSRA